MNESRLKAQHVVGLLAVHGKSIYATRRTLRKLYARMGLRNTARMSVQSLALEHGLLAGLVGSELMTSALQTRFDDVKLGYEVAAFCAVSF